MLRNNIKELMERKDVTITDLSRKIERSYSNTHYMVNAEDLSNFRLGTIVDTAEVLKVKVEELYNKED